MFEKMALFYEEHTEFCDQVLRVAFGIGVLIVSTCLFVSMGRDICEVLLF